MIAFVKGVLDSVAEDHIVVEHSGFGTKIFMPKAISAGLPKVGEIVKIYTYMNVREDAVALFGFTCENDLKLFKQLITVKGVGPKNAQAVMAVLRSDELVSAIILEDTKAIQSAPGIGKRTAEMIVVELKDKLKSTSFYKDDIKEIREAKPAVKQLSGSLSEAVEALISLGYSDKEAEKAVNTVKDMYGDTMSVEDLLKKALKVI